MADAPRIAIDAMGGDGGPAVTVAGAALARKRMPELRFILFGDQQQISTELAHHPALKDGVDLIHTDLVIAGNDRAGHALRRGRESSMALANTSEAKPPTTPSTWAACSSRSPVT